MIRLTGNVISKGAALGTAAVVRWVAGVAQLSPRILEEMARVAKRGLAEPIEVVIVSEELERAASLTIPGVSIVGIIAETARDAGSYPFPVLSGVMDATSRVTDDVLVLLDADRGIALVDPDGTTVAAYQAERERISPRRRIYIDYAHEPARTADGRVIRVAGAGMTEDAIAAACAAGADSILIPASWCAFLAPDEDAEQRDALMALLRAAGGKPVTLAGDLESLSAPALLQAAVTAEVTLALPAEACLDGMGEVVEYLDEIGRELTAVEAEWRPVRLAALIRSDLAEPSEAELGCERLVIDLSDVWDVSDPGRLEWLDTWLTASARVLAPSEVVLPSGAIAAVVDIAALGASTLCVAPDEVPAVKELLRSADLGTARASLFQ